MLLASFLSVPIGSPRDGEQDGYADDHDDQSDRSVRAQVGDTLAHRRPRCGPGWPFGGRYPAWPEQRLPKEGEKRRQQGHGDKQPEQHGDRHAGAEVAEEALDLVGESPAGLRCTTATRLSPSRANSLAVWISVLIAGAFEGVRSLPWPVESDGRYSTARAVATIQKTMMRELAGPAVTHASARAALLLRGVSLLVLGAGCMLTDTQPVGIIRPR